MLKKIAKKIVKRANLWYYIRRGKGVKNGEFEKGRRNSK